MALALHHIRSVDTGCLNLDQHLCRAGCRGFPVCQFQYFWPTKMSYVYILHMFGNAQILFVIVLAGLIYLIS